MRRLFRLVRPLRRQSGPTSPPTTNASKYGNSGGYYRSAYRPLSADQIRDRRFGLRRRGLAADEVEAFLDRVADELAATQLELRVTRDENVRIKEALRDWQSRQARARA